MLIKALCDYDKVRERKNDEPKNGFSLQAVSFEILLTLDGDIADIINIKKEVPVNAKGKTKLEPIKIILPKRTEKTAICSNIVEHRPLYIFGLNYDKGTFTPEDSKQKAQKSHDDFREKNLEFCKDLTSDIAKAYCRFIEKWDSESQNENKYLLDVGKEYTNSYFCFGLDGHPEILLHEDKELIYKYSKMCDSEDSNEDEIKTMCAIYGEELPVARIHNKISGIAGGNPTGGVMVGMKESAFESYGKKQSFNSNISQKAMESYTSVLNILLSDKNHKVEIDEMTIVFFGLVNNDNNECSLMQAMFGGSNRFNDDDKIKSILQQASIGVVPELSAFEIDKNATFYIVGLTPNSSRISQKFIHKDKFGTIIKNVMQHQVDMRVSEDGQNITLWDIKRGLISPKSTKEKIPSSFIASLLRAILNGTNYPDGLFATVVRKVKTDNDDKEKGFRSLNDTRLGIIKAYLNRKSRLLNQKEEFKMALDKTNTNSAYLCGRLFAILEKIQRDATDVKLNNTIKDAYFKTACSRPATVFPRLVVLSQNHLRKIEGNYLSNLAIEVEDMLVGEFPQILSLDEQGKFIIGYAQQNKDLYTSKKDKNQD